MFASEAPLRTANRTRPASLWPGSTNPRRRAAHQAPPAAFPLSTVPAFLGGQYSECVCACLAQGRPRASNTGRADPVRDPWKEWRCLLVRTHFNAERYHPGSCATECPRRARSRARHSARARWASSRSTQRTSTRCSAGAGGRRRCCRDGSQSFRGLKGAGRPWFGDRAERFWVVTYLCMGCGGGIERVNRERADFTSHNYAPKKRPKNMVVESKWSLSGPDIDLSFLNFGFSSLGAEDLFGLGCIQGRHGTLSWPFPPLVFRGKGVYRVLCHM